MKKESLKLYRVTLKGMQSGLLSSSVRYGEAYVVAQDPTEAYTKLHNYLNSKNIGFSYERELHRVELIAEDCEYPDCKTMLYL